MRKCTLTALVVAACTGGRGAGDSRATPRGSTPAAIAAQDTAALPLFAGTLAMVQAPSQVAGARPAILRAVHMRQDSGYDHVVFEFSGDSLPGYRVQYVTEPIRACGSGEVVWPAGEGQLIVRLEPAQAHDSLGNVTLAEPALSPQLPTLKALRLVCDFEGQVQWAVRLGATRRFRVLTASRPARVIFDVRHHD